MLDIAVVVQALWRAEARTLCVFLRGSTLQCVQAGAVVGIGDDSDTTLIKPWVDGFPAWSHSKERACTWLSTQVLVTRPPPPPSRHFEA